MTKELEALESIKSVLYWYYDCNSISRNYRKQKEFDTIEKALLKAQEQEKVLNIIEEKDVDIYILKRCKKVNEYNSKIVHIIGETRELTEEEFELLKAYFEKFIQK